MVDYEKISFRLYNSKEGGMGWSKGLEICYVLKGKAHFDIMKNEQWFIHENDVFVINMYDMYQILPEPNSLVLAMLIPKELALNLYPELDNLKIECFSFLFEDAVQAHFDRIRKGMAEIFELYSKNDSQMQVRMRGAVSSLLSEIIGSFGKSKENINNGVKDGSLGKKGIEQLGLLIEYIQMHYQEEISLAQFSEKSYYSPSHLSHLMRMELGISFTDYLKTVRLQRALQLLRQGKSVTAIAERTGFVNSNAFIKAFRNAYGMTPGKYKSTQQKNLPHAVMETERMTGLSNAESHLFDRLFSYLDKKITGKTEEAEPSKFELCGIKVHIGKSKKEMSKNWKFSINGGYAKRMMYGHVQKTIRRIQNEIGFRYIRCKGIFDDELQVCTRNASGKLVFNFVFLDHIFDFICSCNAKPWVEFSYMPSALCTKHTKGQDLWLIAMPDKLQEWLSLVWQTLLHIKERYGENEVSQWIITPFADIFLVDMHMRDREGYFEFYKKTYELIRLGLPETKIAARGTFEKDGNGLGNYMVREKLLPDFWTMVDYNSVSPAEETGELNLAENMEAYPMIISQNTGHLKHQIAWQKAELKKHGIYNMPLLLAEWNSTIWQRDLCSDTVYKACWLLKNILENCNDVLGFSYWHASDWNDDYLPSSNRFHGGFGLFTRDDIPKAVYGALRFLGRAEGKIQEQGNGYFVLNAEGKIMIYLYNYCPYDILYRYRHVRDISQNNRYSVFEKKSDICYRIELEGMAKGTYQKKVYQMDRKVGSACDAWMQMGAPEKLEEAEYKYIIAASMPKCSISEITVENEYVVQSILEPHAIQLIELQRIAD